MLTQPCCCPQMAFPHYTAFLIQDLPQLRLLDLMWASRDPVIFGDTPMRLTQLEDLSPSLPDFSGLEQLPLHVTYSSLHTRERLDRVTAPCLQCCSGLQSLMLHANEDVHSHAVDLCA